MRKKRSNSTGQAGNRYRADPPRNTARHATSIPASQRQRKRSSEETFAIGDAVMRPRKIQPVAAIPPATQMKGIHVAAMSSRLLANTRPGYRELMQGGSTLPSVGAAFARRQMEMERLWLLDRIRSQRQL